MKAINRATGILTEVPKMWQLYDERGCFLPLSDQDLYDFIEPNPDEDPALSECDGQQGSHVACIKVLSIYMYLYAGPPLI